MVIQLRMIKQTDLLLDEQNDITDVNIPRTNQCAFPTEHAFLDLFRERADLSPTQRESDLSHIEIDQTAGAASGCASAARDTGKKRGFMFLYLNQQAVVERLKIKLSRAWFQIA